MLVFSTQLCELLPLEPSLRFNSPPSSPSLCDKYTVYTVRKMGLILRSIERMLKMQFSMARNFMLQPLRRYDAPCL